MHGAADEPQRAQLGDVRRLRFMSLAVVRLRRRKVSVLHASELLQRDHVSPCTTSLARAAASCVWISVRPHRSRLRKARRRLNFLNLHDVQPRGAEANASPPNPLDACP